MLSLLWDHTRDAGKQDDEALRVWLSWVHWLAREDRDALLEALSMMFAADRAARRRGRKKSLFVASGNKQSLTPLGVVAADPRGVGPFCVKRSLYARAANSFLARPNPALMRRRALSLPRPWGMVTTSGSDIAGRLLEADRACGDDAHTGKALALSGAGVCELSSR
jgi:hypothetical protein